MAGQPRRESSEVLNPALVRAWRPRESRDVFPQCLSLRADEWPCSDGSVGLDNLLFSPWFLSLPELGW